MLSSLKKKSDIYIHNFYYYRLRHLVVAFGYQLVHGSSNISLHILVSRHVMLSSLKEGGTNRVTNPRSVYVYMVCVTS